MTLAEWVARLRQTSWDLHVNGDISLSAWHELDALMKEISASLPAEQPSSSSAKPEEIETRLSTLEAGLAKLIESHSTLLQQEALYRQTHFF